MMKMYRVENYHGGEQPNETLSADSYEIAKTLQRGEFSLIINNVTNEVYE